MDLLKKFLGQSTWKKEWQEELAQSLQEAQHGLNVHMVVAIANESDFYAEVLFILSFLGLSFGAALGWYFQENITDLNNLLLFPVAGFAVGASLFQFRHFYLARFAPRAVRERVALKAKSLFYDHSQNLKGRLAVLYFSELEEEVLFVTSPDLIDQVPAAELQSTLSNFIQRYKRTRPLEALRPALLKLGELLRNSLGAASDTQFVPDDLTKPIYLGASDQALSHLRIPIMKGSKDIN